MSANRGAWFDYSRLIDIGEKSEFAHCGSENGMLAWHAKVKMFDEDQNNKENDRGHKKPPGGFKLPPTTWVAWIAIIGSIVALMLVQDRMTTQAGTAVSRGFFQKFDPTRLRRRRSVSIRRRPR